MKIDNQPQFSTKFYPQNNSNCVDDANLSNSFYTDFKEKQNCMHCHPDKCEESIMCYQAWMSSCEAHLFCEATSRLSYELCKAKTLCDVKIIIDSISCLFSASALKEHALADIIRSYSMLKNKKCCYIDHCCKKGCE